MTKREFILCCSLFEKYFKGKSLKEILNDKKLVEYKLEHPKFDFSSYPRFGSNDFETDDTYLGIDSCIMYLINGIMELNRYRNSKNMFIGSVEDFLKLFKIPLEDIV